MGQAAARRRATALAPALVVALALALALAGCGGGETPALSVYRTYPPVSFKPFGLGRYGIGFVVPSNWAYLPDLVHPPVIAIIASGPAVISVSRYARTGPPPTGTTDLLQARTALLGAIKAGQPAFRLLSSRTTSIGGQPAIVLDAIEAIAGQRRHVVSTHVFLAHSEVVIEEYAPVAEFAAVDNEVFAKVLASLQLLPGART